MPRESKKRCLELGHQPKSPRKAIREHCVKCCNGSYNEVDLCCSKTCLLFRYRKSKLTVENNQPRVFNCKLIKDYCLTCAESYPEVVNCQLTDCSLWPFRLGKSPWREKVMTEEQKEKFLERIGKKKENGESAPVGLVKED